MKRTLISLTTVSLAFVAPAFAGTLETYDFNDFDAVKTSAGINVVFEQGPAHSVVADFDRGERSDIKVRQDDGVLYISKRSSKPWSKNKARVEVRVTAPSLNSVTTSSGSNFKATGISADGFDLNVASGGTAKVSGTCGRLSIKASSGGSASAKGMTCDAVDAAASSGGSVSAHANTRGTSNTSSGGSVVIYGNPADQNANRSKSGGSTTFK